MEVKMMSQRAHRQNGMSLQTRWIDGKPFVQDEDGRMVAIPAGGAPEDGEGGEGASGSDDGKGGSEGASGSGDPGSEGDGKPKEADYVSRAEYEAALERMRAADRAKNAKDTELEELRQFKKEMEDKDRSETEKLQRDLQEAAQRAEESAGRATTAELKLAMVLTNGKRDKPFRDSEDVLRWVDVGDVTNDDGELDEKALTKALDELAEKKPYLLAESSSKDDGDGDEGKEGSSGPSGTSQNKDRNKGKGIDKDALAKKYPALRR